ncbi:MAG: ROK family protein [Candidatus Marinimicrobia bacterium]|nr:ROK family protein [Candidatus Neomarinimicrobiota bacterium]
MNKDFVLSIDVGGTNTAFGLVDKTGYCIAKDSLRTNSGKTAEELFTHLFMQFSNTLKEFKKDHHLVGVGIGAPNANYYTGEVKAPPNLTWHDVNLVQLLSQFVDVPVVITNDANAAALGEMHFGAAKNMKHFIEITLGTGLGSGIVVDGKVVYGQDGFAGELGHVTAIFDGRICGCGRKGCLEAYASATGIVKTAVEMMDTINGDSELLHIDKEKLESRDVFVAAQNGDQLALEIFEKTGEILGRTLANSVVHTSPEAFIFFGGMAQAGDLILDPVRRHLEKNVMKVFKGKTKVLPSGLPGTDAAILGAAALIWNELDS